MLFLDFRTSHVGGGVLDEPHVLEGDGLARPLSMRLLGSRIPPARVDGREVVFATHGFNVSWKKGVRALARLERDLQLGSKFLFVGVLWPGDFWIPVVNYPAEAEDAVRCGRSLARFANASLSGAGAISLVSHSLGARLVLEATKHMSRRVREVCLLAAAVDDDCLSTRQYADARANAEHISVLASREDLVLRLAYPVGDFLSDVFYDDDDPLHGALGYRGPKPEVAGVEHAQIPRSLDYGHGDYLPPDDLDRSNPKVARAELFVADALIR